jgi:hypothetical protein
MKRLPVLRIIAFALYNVARRLLMGVKTINSAGHYLPPVWIARDIANASEWMPMWARMLR